MTEDYEDRAYKVDRRLAEYTGLPLWSITDMRRYMPEAYRDLTTEYDEFIRNAPAIKEPVNRMYIPVVTIAIAVAILAMWILTKL